MSKHDDAKRDEASAYHATPQALVRALDLMPEAVEIVDLDTRYVFVNKAFEEIMGYSLEEAIGHTPQELLRSGVHDESYYKNIIDTVQRGEVWQGEIVGKNQFGDTFEQLATIAPVLDEDGEIIQYIGIKQPFNDDAVEAEGGQPSDLLSRVRTRNLFQRAMLSKTSEALALIDRKTGQFADGNGSATELFGIELKTFRRTRLVDILAAASKDERSAIDQALESSQELRLRRLYITTPQGERVISLKLEPTVIDGRELFVAIMRDVAFEVQQSEELELVTDNLRVAKEELVASASLAIVGQLAAAVGHEINNPAQVLRSCLEHLGERQGELNPAEVSELISDALAGLTRIESVTRELVPFSSTGESDFEAVDLNECVRRGLRMAHNELRHRSRVVEALGKIPLVEGSEARLTQLVTALLLSIARRIDEDKEDNVIVISSAETSKDIRLVLDCRVATQSQFFEELQQRLSKGDGPQIPAGSQWISLILCLQIAVVHGGNLEVESISEGKAKIALTLPNKFPTSVAEEPTRKRVLIVDDEELVLRSLKRMLRKGYDVDISTTGKQALNLITNNDYDAIVCDIMMPQMSGVALFQKLKEIKPEACDRIMFISAGTFTDKTKASTTETERPVLGKPVRKDDLRAAVAALCELEG